MTRARALRRAVLAAILTCVIVGAALVGRLRWDEHRLAQRLAHIDRALSSARVTRRSCPRSGDCECRVESASDTFTECHLVDGHVALWIRSLDPCFKQWIAVDSTWDGGGSGERVGALWITEQPRRVAAGWRVLAVAPCLD